MERLTELDENGNIRVKAFNIENVESGNWKVMINAMYELPTKKRGFLQSKLKN